MISASAQTQGMKVTKVSDAEQAGRDDERSRILRDELRKARDAVESLAKRKAERLAAGDRVGAEEAEAAHVRTLADVSALEREIGGARASAATPPAVATPKGATAITARVTAPAPPAAPAATPPWWDVYAKAPGPRASVSRESAAPVALTHPITTPAVQVPDSGRRME